jgi:spore coat protein U-like protein
MTVFPSTIFAMRPPAAGRPRKALAPGGVSLLAMLAILTVSLPAVAATATSSLGVSATVQATCLNVATAMAFGTYTGVVVDSTATITVTCTNTTPYTVSLDAGTGITPTATVTTRKMTGVPGVFLNYALFSNTGRTTNWGITVGTDTVAGVATGAGQVLTVYGRVAAGQFVTPGGYADTVTATVTY